MATGLDEDYKKPRNIADQIVRLVDDESVRLEDRLRLITQYVLYRDGVFLTDVGKLLSHSQLPPQDGEIIQNLELLGARAFRQVKDTRQIPPPVFDRKQVPTDGGEDLSLSRYDPTIKLMLEDQLRGSLDHSLFPYTKPLLDANDGILGQVNVSQASLRSAKPTWARTRPSAMEPRQRIIVFVAGGATYSESRACYEVSRAFSKDVFLSTSHMLNPSLFLRQVADLSVDRRRLDLPPDRPKPKAPAHIFERDAPPQQPSLESATAGVASLTLKSDGQAQHNKPSNGAIQTSAKAHPLPSPTFLTGSTGKPAKQTKEKKRGFFKF